MLRLFALLLLFAGSARADITHKLTSSVQLHVEGAGSQASRVGSTYSVSGSNISVSSSGSFGGLSALTSGTAVGYTPMSAEITTAGDAFTFSESFIEGDDVTSATTVSSGVVTSLPMLGTTTTSSGGVAGALAGTIATDGAMTITAGGAGTNVTGQHVSEITIR